MLHQSSRKSQEMEWGEPCQKAEEKGAVAAGSAGRTLVAAANVVYLDLSDG